MKAEPCVIPQVWQKGRTKGRGKMASTSCVSRGTVPTSTCGHSVLKDDFKAGSIGALFSYIRARCCGGLFTKRWK